MRAKVYNALNLFHAVYLKRFSNNLRVLAYHTVEDPKMFEKQLVFLQQNYSIIDLKTLQDHLYKDIELPKKPLLITFDDGDISVWKNGLKILKKHKAPSVLFVVTSLINTNKPFWWDQIRYYLDGDKGVQKSWEVKKWKNMERLRYLENLIEKSDKPKLQKTQLNNSQLEQLQAAGMQIANHSHTHPMFDQCSKQEIKNELNTSFEILDKLGFQGNVFAYPNGNFAPVAEVGLKEAGIEIAFLFDHKINPRQINPLRISRIRVDTHTAIKEFKVKVSGLHSYIYHNFRKRL